MEDQAGLCGERQFRAVFDAQYGLLRNFLAFRFGDLDQAEDAAQQAFVILWENCGKILPGQAKKFLFTTAIRQSLNQVRRQKMVADFALGFDGQPYAAPPDALLEEKELHNRLEHAIRSLPDKQREVFLMNRIEKHTYAEIAGLLEISVKAVEKRMHQALLSLRHVIPTI